MTATDDDMCTIRVCTGSRSIYYTYMRQERNDMKLYSIVCAATRDRTMTTTTTTLECASFHVNTEYRIIILQYI